MSSITDFITELIRAANEVRKIGPFEKRRLLDRAYRTIEEGRDQVGIPRDGTDFDEAIDLLTMSRSVLNFSDEEVKAAMAVSRQEVILWKPELSA